MPWNRGRVNIPSFTLFLQSPILAIQGTNGRTEFVLSLLAVLFGDDDFILTLFEGATVDQCQHLNVGLLVFVLEAFLSGAQRLGGSVS